MKNLLLSLLLLLLPLPAIASPKEIPANYMIWRGKLINLDHLWGKGVLPTASQIAPTTATISQPAESREARHNRQRVAFENARSQILQEYLRNVR